MFPQIFRFVFFFFFDACLVFIFNKCAENNWEIAKWIVVFLEGKMSFTKLSLSIGYVNFNHR